MYYPNLKTSDSELRALKHLDSTTKSKIIPIFELTRSRISKTFPEGSIVRRLEQLKQSYGEYRFILDLCTEEDLMNSETESLFDEDNGYENWLFFLKTNTNPTTIPCVLYIEDGGKSNFQEQARKLYRQHGSICLRTSAADENATKLLNWLIEVVPQENIIVCAILYFIEPGNLPKYEKICDDYISDVIGNKQPFTITFPASSFPKYITDIPGCHDAEGSFPASELLLENKITNKYPNLPISKSDFASVHPIRYKTGGGNWIPRIDIFDGINFHYTRSRRDDGGYLQAATSLKPNMLSSLNNSWGAQQILFAKSGKYLEKAPLFGFR